MHVCLERKPLYCIETHAGASQAQGSPVSKDLACTLICSSWQGVDIRSGAYSVASHVRGSSDPMPDTSQAPDAAAPVMDLVTRTLSTPVFGDPVRPPRPASKAAPSISSLPSPYTDEGGERPFTAASLWTHDDFSSMVRPALQSRPSQFLLTRPGLPKGEVLPAVLPGFNQLHET